MPTAAHMTYGAVSGAALAAVGPGASPLRGAAEGAAIWAASYFGWIPAAGILHPAHDHPFRRNALMIAAHLVWSATQIIAYRELVRARDAMLRAGPIADAPEEADERP